MKNDIRSQQVIRAVTQARHTYFISRSTIDREFFRRRYMSLGAVVLDGSETMEMRQEALEAMHRLQLTLG
jgi:hypothetical protein